MANPEVFFDSNVLLYTDDSRFPRHQRLALDLTKLNLSQKTGSVSIQVLQEYFANATRKLKVDALLARQKTQVFSNFKVFKPDQHDILAAIDLHLIHQISFWDAMIVRAAIQSGCGTLYSEDMQHGQRINSVQIINPFL
jgi:predicted nucleic acid-binding protein